MSTMRHYDSEVDTPIATQVTTGPLMTEQVTVRIAPRSQPTSGAYRLKAATDWTWRDLRDYLAHEIGRRHGTDALSDNPAKEAGILKGFMNRWGTEGAVEIARYAVEICDARWKRCPLYIERFTVAQDHVFAGVIAERLYR